MAISRTNNYDERGAVLVHVAFALLALMAFSTFSVDYGLFWWGRRQAQNAADAGALAGAQAMILSTDTSDTGPAKLSAKALAERNLVVGQALNVDVTNDIIISPCPDTPSETCIRVNVYRDAAHGNPLPMFAGNFIGLFQQDVRATATARLAAGNFAECLKPFAIMDRFTDNNANGVYDAGDVYIAPTADDPGTGYSALAPPVGSYGTVITLKTGPHTEALSPGWWHPLDYGSGGNTYRDAIAGCVPGAGHGVGDIVDEENGVMQGPTQQGLLDLLNLDLQANWNPSTQSIEGGCMTAGTCKLSPRIVPIPVFDPAHWVNTGGDNQAEIKLVNIIGFFILDPNNVIDPPVGFDPNFDVAGVLINLPGSYSAGHSETNSAASFLKTVILVR